MSPIRSMFHWEDLSDISSLTCLKSDSTPSIRLGGRGGFVGSQGSPQILVLCPLLIRVRIPFQVSAFQKGFPNERRFVPQTSSKNIRIRKVPSFQKSCQETSWSLEYSPSMFSKQSQIEVFQISQAKSTLFLWQSHSLPGDPMHCSFSRFLVPPYIRQDAIYLITYVFREFEAVHCIDRQRHSHRL